MSWLSEINTPKSPAPLKPIVVTEEEMRAYLEAELPGQEHVWGREIEFWWRWALKERYKYLWFDFPEKKKEEGK